MRLYDYAASCNCYKARLLLVQLGLRYERVPVDIFAGETLTHEYARINPARTVPVLETDEGFLPESNAILTYLAEGTEFMPTARFERAQVVRWLLYEQTEVVYMIGGLRFRLLVGRWTAEEPEAARRARGARDVLGVLEEQLSHRPFLVGSYSIADIAVYGYAHRADEAGIDLAPYEHVRRWFRRIEEQPGCVEDVEPYPANAAPGAGRSIYD
jgi:glutathione S-transferase